MYIYYLNPHLLFTYKKCIGHAGSTADISSTFIHFYPLSSTFIHWPAFDFYWLSTDFLKAVHLSHPWMWCEGKCCHPMMQLKFWDAVAKTFTLHPILCIMNHLENVGPASHMEESEGEHRWIGSNFNQVLLCTSRCCNVLLGATMYF